MHSGVVRYTFTNIALCTTIVHYHRTVIHKHTDSRMQNNVTFLSLIYIQLECYYVTLRWTEPSGFAIHGFTYPQMVPPIKFVNPIDFYTAGEVFLVQIFTEISLAFLSFQPSTGIMPLNRSRSPPSKPVPTHRS